MILQYIGPVNYTVLFLVLGVSKLFGAFLLPPGTFKPVSLAHFMCYGHTYLVTRDIACVLLKAYTPYDSSTMCLGTTVETKSLKL